MGDSAEDNAKSSSASTCLYADLEDFANQDSVNDGSLPNPEPVTKRIRIGLEAGTSTDQSSLREAVAALERTMETRLTRIENQFTVMQATIIDQISHSSTQEQHYMKSLASVLQRDITSLREIVNTKDVSSEQVLSSSIRAL